MTDKVKEIYDGGKKNKRFLEMLYIADKDTPPNIFSDDLTKHIFAATYYGWLIAMYGVGWKEQINSKQ